MCAVRNLRALFPTPSSVGVLPFSRVCSLLGAHSTAAEHDVLEELQRVCVLVQGCWVVRSEVLYPKDYASPHHGVGSDVMCRARDLTVGDFIWVGSRVTAWGRSHVSAWGGSPVAAWGGSPVTAWGGSPVAAWGGSPVAAWGGGCVAARQGNIMWFALSSGPSSCTSPLLRW